MVINIVYVLFMLASAWATWKVSGYGLDAVDGKDIKNSTVVTLSFISALTFIDIFMDSAVRLFGN